MKWIVQLLPKGKQAKLRLQHVELRIALQTVAKVLLLSFAVRQAASLTRYRAGATVEISPQVSGRD
jgi:hypothetical protein